MGEWIKCSEMLPGNGYTDKEFLMTGESLSGITTIST